jgi:hypothetical protein
MGSADRMAEPERGFYSFGWYVSTRLEQTIGGLDNRRFTGNSPDA